MSEDHAVAVASTGVNNGESDGYGNGTNESDTESENGKAGLFGSIFNLTNTVLGAGILSFPNGFYSTGLISGMVLVAIFCVLNVLTMRILFMGVKYAPRKVTSYEDLTAVYFGTVMKKINEAVMMITLIAPLVIYLCIIGDSICPILTHFLPDDNFFVQREFVIGAIGVIIIFPLCLARKLDSLKYTSLISFISVVYVGFMIPITGIVKLAKIGAPPGLTENLVLNRGLYHGIAPKFFMALPVYAFSFCCHIVCVPIFNELKRPTMPRLDIVVFVVYALVTVLYCCVGIFGFLSYGENTLPDILMNFEGDAWEAGIGRVCMAIVSIFSFPLVSFVQRSSTNSVFFGGKEMDPFKLVIFSSLLFIGNLLVALLIPDIMIAFGFTGSVGVVLISFGYPAIIYWKLIPKFKTRFKPFLYVIPIILILASIFMMIAGPMASVFKIVQGDEEG